MATGGERLLSASVALPERDGSAVDQLIVGTGFGIAEARTTKDPLILPEDDGDAMTPLSTTPATG